MEERLLHDWTRRFGTAFLVSAAVMVATLLPAAAASHSAASHSAASPSTGTAAGGGGFLSPSPGLVTYAARGDLTVTWSPGDVTTDSWQLVRSSAPLDINGGCDAVSWVSEAPIQTSSTSMVLAGQEADRCYRYSVWSGSDLSADPIYVSGPVRTLTIWNGRYNLYHHGIFASQATITWCVAASVEMMLNIIKDQDDHSRADQEAYITYARRNDLYFTPKAKGTDARGWAVALQHFGGGDYHDVSNPRFKASIREAVRRLRETGKPVGLVVAHSNHAWVLTGFEASTDPALDYTAQITAVYVSGPLWPRSSSSGGYDPPPDTRLTYDQLRQFHTRYYDSEGPNNPWEGTFVSILP